MVFVRFYKCQKTEGKKHKKVSLFFYETLTGKVTCNKTSFKAALQQNLQLQLTSTFLPKVNIDSMFSAFLNHVSSVYFLY